MLTKCPSDRELIAYFNTVEKKDYEDFTDKEKAIDYHLIEMNCPICHNRLAKLERLC